MQSHEIPTEPLAALLTYDRFAELISCSKSTVIRLVNRGEVRVVYVAPGAPRIPRTEAARLAEQARCVAER